VLGGKIEIHGRGDGTDGTGPERTGRSLVAATTSMVT
jgi:hypothetical protein